MISTTAKKAETGECLSYAETHKVGEIPFQILINDMSSIEWVKWFVLAEQDPWFSGMEDFKWFVMSGMVEVICHSRMGEMMYGRKGF